MRASHSAVQGVHTVIQVSDCVDPAADMSDYNLSDDMSDDMVNKSV